MATELDIVEYHKGEYVEIDFFAKNRDGTVLTSPASQVVTMTIGETASGDPLLTFTTTGGKIVLTDAPTAKFTIGLLEADLTTLIEGRTYFYNIWVGTSQPTLQAKGRFVLQNSIET